MKTTTCKIEYCDKRKFARGLCTTHYQRLRTHGNPTYMAIRPVYYERSQKVRVRRNCMVTDCSKPVDSLNLCQMHYMRQRNNGHYSIVKQVVGENRTKHPLYKSFHAMHGRCRNPNNTHYEFYGARGISVCDRWTGQSGFSNFIHDMGDRPENFTLDRIDNSKGYSPENCRWASKKLQSANTRLPKTNKSGYKGVSLFKKTNRWCSSIYIKGKKHHLGYFNTIDEAVEAREKAQLSAAN